MKEFMLTDKVPFGKWRGSTFEDVLNDDPEYMRWAYVSSVFNFREADAVSIEEELGI